MKSAKLADMYKGWFVGNFSPSLYKTTDVEVAIKEYKKGDTETAHYHKIATELTVVQSGRVKMFNKEWRAGEIIIVEPFDVTDFTALEDSVTVVVKLPGANNDKFIVERI